MANNFKVTEGVGPPVATDDVSGVHYQRVKLTVAAEDNTVGIGHAEDAAHASGDGGIMLLVVRKDTATALAGADGDYIPLIVDASGRLWIAPLPAGTNNIGDVDVLTLPAGTVAGSASLPAGTNNIGDVDIASMPGNVNAQLLASAARTATTNSADQSNVNGRGVALLLDVTTNPGGIETLTVRIEAKLGGVYRAITAFAAVDVAANATYVYLLYPGIVETAAVANVEVQGLVLPRDWRAKVTHSSTGSWTYSLEASVLV